MRRLFRFVLLCLLALALPLQGATAAAAMGGGHGLAMAAGHETAASCPHHAAAHHAGPATHHASCGACCGPVVAQQPLLTVAPVAARWAAVRAAREPTLRAQFLTGGPDRPPRIA